MIETVNLRLEPLRKEHAVLLFALLSDAQLYALMPEQQPRSLHVLEKRYTMLETRKSPMARSIG